MQPFYLLCLYISPATFPVLLWNSRCVFFIMGCVFPSHNWKKAFESILDSLYWKWSHNSSGFVCIYMTNESMMDPEKWLQELLHVYLPYISKECMRNGILHWRENQALTMSRAYWCDGSLVKRVAKSFGSTWGTVNFSCITIPLKIKGQFHSLRHSFISVFASTGLMLFTHFHGQFLHESLILSMSGFGAVWGNQWRKLVFAVSGIDSQVERLRPGVMSLVVLLWDLNP